MECREVRRLADAFVSEQLLVETTQAIVAHLEQCPACRAEVEALRRLRAATRAAFNASSDLQASPAFVAGLSVRLQQVNVAPRPARAHWRWMAIAASLLLIAGAGVGLRMSSASALLDLLRAAVGDYLNCALTFRLAERPIPLAAAVRYDVAYRALDAVVPSSTALPGGTLEILDRHSCVYQGRRFAHIVMRYKGQAVSLLVSADSRSAASLWAAGPPSDGTLSELTTLEGMRVTAFHQARHSAFVVSSLGENDVKDVARVMVGPVSRALTGA